MGGRPSISRPSSIPGKYFEFKTDIRGFGDIINADTHQNRDLCNKYAVKYYNIPSRISQASTIRRCWSRISSIVTFPKIRRLLIIANRISFFNSAGPHRHVKPDKPQNPEYINILLYSGCAKLKPNYFIYSQICLENYRIDVNIGLKSEYTRKIGHNLANILI